LLGECANGAQAVEAIRERKPDAVFLDVQMPRMDGFSVCKTVGIEAMPQVVFVTAYDQYALQAFEVHAVDYLLKPFDRARFRQTLEHLRKRRRGQDSGPVGSDLNALLRALKAGTTTVDRLAVKTDGRLVFLRFDEIDWVEAEGNYVKFHGGEGTHLVRETLTWCEAELPSSRFMRISRSVLVNTDRIKEVQPLFYGDHVVILRDGTRLNLSRTYRDRLDRFIHGS
jgi:two-component system LytT family response regulator